MQELFDAVREACTAAIWSRGVQLSRAGAVVAERSNKDEIELRVTTRQGLVSPLVVLYPDDADWSCECNSRDDACVHVAAAVIAVRQAHKEGKGLPGADRAPGHVGYRFTRSPEGLSVARFIVSAGGEAEVRTTLATLRSSKAQTPPFAATQDDIEVERALGSRLWGLVPRLTMPKLLALLIDHEDVKIDGRRTRVGDAIPVIQARVEERGEGFLVLLEQAKEITEVFKNGAVRCGDVLRPIRDPGLSGRELDELRRGRVYAADAAHELVALASWAGPSKFACFLSSELQPSTQALEKEAFAC